MAHFAQLDDDNIVINVIVVANEDIADPVTGEDNEEMGVAVCRFHFGPDSNWKQTSYHGSFRSHFAGKGMIYDEVKDCFHPPRPLEILTLEPLESWSLVQTGDRWGWEPPTPQPGPGYDWNESTTTWDEVPD